MSAFAITVPKLGLTMEEGAIVEWFKADGEAISKGQLLFSVETDKIVSDVECEVDGFLQRVAALNEVLPVSAVVAYVHATAEAALVAARGEKAAATAAPKTAAVVAGPPPAVPEPVGGEVVRESHPASLTDGGRKLVSPIARTLATDRGIDVSTLSGSGPGGVVLKRDVPGKAVVAPVPAAVLASAGPLRQPMSSLRRAVSQRMMKSLSGSAQMTAFGKIDMTEAVRVRETLAAAADTLGARVTYTDLVLKAAAGALRAVPQINASIDGDDVVTWPDVHIGLAVALDDGLVVPVIRHVDRLSLPELSRARADLIARARAGKLARDEVEGATFTLSNFGSYGGDFETPVLNPPQSALLGIGQITQEAAVRDGAIVIRSLMTISMTFDHRLIDGAVAGRFRAHLKSLLEAPALWLATLR